MSKSVIFKKVRYKKSHNNCSILHFFILLSLFNENSILHCLKCDFKM